MSSRALCGLLVIASFAACAIPEPPPGGPEDKTPPSVLETYPEDGASGVPVDAGIRISFDESMTRSRMERLVAFYPSVMIAKTRWKGNTVTLSPEEPLHPDTTYVAELKAGFSDAHGVRSVEPHRFAFATSTHIDSGVIEGRVLFRRKPTAKGVVQLFVLPKDTAFAPEAARPDRLTTVSGEGLFTFGALPTGNRSFILWAFQDENSNESFDGDREAAALLPDTIVLRDAFPRSPGHEIFIVDPKEPATISGVIENATGNDAVPVTVTMHAVSDTTPPTYYTTCDAEGAYRFEAVRGDVYTLFGFLDLKADSLCRAYPCPEDSSRACREPCVQYPDTLVVEPGGKLELRKMVLEAGRAKEE